MTIKNKHMDGKKNERRKRALARLEQVDLPNYKRILKVLPEDGDIKVENRILKQIDRVGKEIETLKSRIK